MDFFNLLTDKAVIFSIANSIYVLSYVVTNMLWLRILAVVAAASTFPYFYFQDTPLWVPLFWQSMFLMVNLVNLILLLIAMRPTRLSPDDASLHKHVFSDLRPHEMMPMLKRAERRSHESGAYLLRHGEQNDELFLMLEGHCEVTREGKSVATVEPFEFIGEMSFVGNAPVSGDVRVTEPSVFYVWNRGSLDALFRKQALYKSYLYQICGVGMAGKLRKMNENASGGLATAVPSMEAGSRASES